MRGIAVACLSLLCLSGCRSGGPAEALVTPAPTPAIAVALTGPESPEPRKLNQPPAPRAKDLSTPHDPFQTKPGAVAQCPAALAPAQLPRPNYPLSRIPSVSPVAPAVKGPPQSAPSEFPNGSAHLPPTYTSTYVPPPPTSAYVPPTLPGFRTDQGAPPARPGGALTQSPHLPGQAAPPPFRTPIGDAREKEKKLEQAYLQSRADALNLKYHGGRAVLNAQSPEVMTSALAPPAPYRPPTIPGTYGVVDAFKASDAKRQEWQSYRSQPPAGAAPMIPTTQPMIPTMPQPPRPNIP